MDESENIRAIKELKHISIFNQGVTIDLGFIDKFLDIVQSLLIAIVEDFISKNVELLPSSNI